MKGDPTIISELNKVLTQELTAINQYFLHARMLKNWGFTKLGEKEYHASIDEMKHADKIIERILFLEGIPNVQRLNKVNIGQEVAEILKSDLELEKSAVTNLKGSIELCEKAQDFTSRSLFQEILASEEDHVDWLETQVELMDKVGVQNYLQGQMES